MDVAITLVILGSLFETELPHVTDQLVPKIPLYRIAGRNIVITEETSEGRTC